MPIENPQHPIPAEATAQPHIIYGKGIDPGISVDAQEMAQTMQALGISEEGISNTTIYMDPKSRFQNFGTHYPNRIGRLRFPHVPEIRAAQGDIIRLSTRMKGKLRTDEEMNRTSVHELEHSAQEERHDRKVTVGHMAIWGLAATGAIIGNRLGKTKTSKTVGTVIGAALGHSAGHMVAPHERQARERARQVRSKAIRRR